MKKNCSVPTGGMTLVQNLSGDSQEDTHLLRELSVLAADFIMAQEWCDNLDYQYLAYGVGGVVGVFLCVLSSRADDVDPCLWVITGDLPPAYIVTDENPTAAEALAAYIGEMEEWVEAVEGGRSVEELIPVNAPPTVEYAEQLRNRLTFLRAEILPHLGNLCTSSASTA